MAKPYLVVRAKIEPSVMDEFIKWYEQVHLPHVMEIPGVVKAFRSRCSSRGINWAAFYQIKDDASVQTAISSDEAERARRDWERWMPHVSELTVEIYAGLGPLPPYHHWN